MANLEVTYNGVKIINTGGVNPPVDITYNGSEIANVTDGQTKIMRCNGKVMLSDVGFSGNTKDHGTLKCNGKLMASDVTVYVQSTEPS